MTNDIDVLLMTWLTSGDAVKRAELTPGGFNLKYNPRPSGRTGGRVGVLFKTGIQCKVLSSDELNSFEYGNYELLCQKMKVDVHVIYRPSYSGKNRVTTATFFEEFQTYLSHAVQTSHSLLIAGDCPVEFTEYSSPVFSVIDQQWKLGHAYADDHQVYCGFHPDSLYSNCESMERCIRYINSWMQGIKLKMNNSKTEYILFGNN